MSKDFVDPKVLIEPYVVSDVFCANLVRYEQIGPCVRLTFATPQTALYEDRPCTDQAVVAKLVLPAEAIATMIEKLQSSLANPIQQIERRNEHMN